MRRKDREKSVEFALDVCDCCDFSVLSVIDTDNMPYAVAVNTVRDGMNIYFHCAKVGRKIDALRANNNVCVSCVSKSSLVPEKFTTEYSSAIAKGKAFEVDSQDEKIHALRLLCERFAKSNMLEFDNEIAASLNHTAVWKIEISEITGKSNIK